LSAKSVLAWQEVSITADQEKQFYDQQYAQHLNAPDDALLCAVADMRLFLADPTHPIYERRRLYAAALDVLTRESLSGKRVLDYGCGPSDWGVMLATEGARVTLLDLSEAAIQLGLKRARANRVSHLVDGQARDAANLSCFRDGEFDLVFANAAVHHTIKYPGALGELIRVIRPGGQLVLAETLGNNPLLNAARRVRARLAGQEEEQGEEIILGDPEIRALLQHLRLIEFQPFHLLSMGKRLLRGKFSSGWARAVVSGLESVDRLLLPMLNRYCGEAVLVFEKPSAK
jgi:SAM-dependent methyltransferase